jgi:lysophospholipase L1-like esterase
MNCVIHYLAVGDSLTVGFGAFSEPGFVERYRYLTQQAEVISITAGGNDLNDAAKQYQVDGNVKVFKSALKKCQENFRQILDMIHDLKSGHSKRYIIRVADLYNPYPQLKEGVIWIQRFNKHLRSFEGENLLVADIYHAFLGREKELLYLDQVHPNVKGYKVMAEQMHRLGYDELDKKNGS